MSSLWLLKIMRRSWCRASLCGTLALTSLRDPICQRCHGGGSCCFPRERRAAGVSGCSHLQKTRFSFFTLSHRPLCPASQAGLPPGAGEVVEFWGLKAQVGDGHPRGLCFPCSVPEPATLPPDTPTAQLGPLGWCCRRGAGPPLLGVGWAQGGEERIRTLCRLSGRVPGTAEWRGQWAVTRAVWAGLGCRGEVRSSHAMGRHLHPAHPDPQGLG